MNRCPGVSVAGKVVAIAVMAALTSSLVTRSAARADAGAGISKKDVHNARTALEEGRWRDSLETYERVLSSSDLKDDELRSEALYYTVLIRLESEPDAWGTEVVQDRLEELKRTRGHGRGPEVRTLLALLESLSNQRDALEEMERHLATERVTREGDRQAAAVAVAAKEELIAAHERSNREFLDRIGSLNRQVEACTSELRTADEQLAERAADLELLTDHLAETQEDQSQMLGTVLAKNEELQLKERELGRTRVALQQKERELAVQAEELEVKEQEIQKREEAIREVTERILTKDEPES